MSRKARVQTSTNVYLLHASASQTHGMRCTRHTWTTANLNNIPSINVHHRGTRTRVAQEVGRVPVPLTLAPSWHTDEGGTRSGSGTGPSDPCTRHTWTTGVSPIRSIRPIRG